MMSVESRAKRILTPLDSYEAIDEAGSSTPLQSFGPLYGSKPLGIYRNNDMADEEAILVTDIGLFFVLRSRAIFVEYKAIESVDITAHGAVLNASSKTQADGVQLNVSSAKPVSIPVRNGRGKYRDVFEFSRFVSRAVADSAMASRDLPQAEPPGSSLIQRAS